MKQKNVIAYDKKIDWEKEIKLKHTIDFTY